MEENKTNLKPEENEILRIIVIKNPDNKEIEFFVDALQTDEDAKEIEEVFLSAMKNRYEDFAAEE